MINNITIHGYKSIKELDSLELRPVNLLVGYNGAGKSNFISFLKMLKAQFKGQLQRYIRMNDSSMEQIVHKGTAITPETGGKLDFGDCSYAFSLAAMEDGGAFFEKELFETAEGRCEYNGGMESRFVQDKTVDFSNLADIRKQIVQWGIYHLNDTSLTASVKKECVLAPDIHIADDFSNLASWLYYLKENTPHAYDRIKFNVSLAFPEFDEFHLQPTTTSNGTEYIRLFWKQKDCDAIFSPNQLSDGTLRFICLCAVLMQPSLPPLIVVDEPELGLHPGAIELMAALLQSASASSQIIVATQSPLLIDQFAFDDLLVIRRNKDESRFERLDEKDYLLWLENYTIGELWTKNVIEGGPVHE